MDKSRQLSPQQSDIPKPQPKEAPGLLLPYQLAWIKESAEVAICEKSRRIGISYAEAAICVLTAAKSREDGGMDCFYMSYNHDMTKQFIRDCEYWCKVYNQAINVSEETLVEKEGDFKSHQIDFASGFQIKTLPGKAASLRSKQGRTVIDEAAFVDDIKAIFKSVFALLMWGGLIRIISTHNGVDNDFNKYIQDSHSGQNDAVVHRTDLKEALDQGLYRRICRVKGQQWSQEKQDKWEQKVRKFYGDDQKEELDVIPSNSGDRYLSLSLIKANIQKGAPVVFLARPEDWATTKPTHLRSQWLQQWYRENIKPHINQLAKRKKYSLGQDFGRKSDLSVIVIYQQQSNLDQHTVLQIELSRLPHKQQQDLSKWLMQDMPNVSAYAIDANGNGESHAERLADEFGDASQHGPIHQIKITANYYEKWGPDFKTALENNAIQLPADENTQEDLRQLRNHKGRPRIPESTGQENRHADSAIAHLMAYCASQQESATTYGYHSPQPNQSYHGDPRQNPHRDSHQSTAIKHQNGIL